VTVTREQFLEWRAPRFGSANPERMTNPVWKWFVETKLNAFQANEHYEGPNSFDAGPCWTFDRFGQSSTKVADGRTIFVAGEHEDHYDPDFYIYNDVVVVEPNGAIEIYGYKSEVFPPTDFHSATQVGDQIIIIGSLGYRQQRKPNFTPVYSLHIPTLQITELKTSGECLQCDAKFSEFKVHPVNR
jgi:hypothetical protein